MSRGGDYRGRDAKVFGRSEVAGFLPVVITTLAAITVISRTPIGSKHENQVNAQNASLECVL